MFNYIEVSQVFDYAGNIERYRVIHFVGVEGFIDNLCEAKELETCLKYALKHMDSCIDYRVRNDMIKFAKTPKALAKRLQPLLDKHFIFEE